MSEATTECRAALHPVAATDKHLRVHLVQLGHMCLCHWWTIFEQKQEVLASILQASFKEACSQPTTPTATRADYVFNSNGIGVEGTISPRSKSSRQSNTAHLTHFAHSATPSKSHIKPCASLAWRKPSEPTVGSNWCCACCFLAPCGNSMAAHCDAKEAASASLKSPSMSSIQFQNHTHGVLAPALNVVGFDWNPNASVMAPAPHSDGMCQNCVCHCPPQLSTLPVHPSTASPASVHPSVLRGHRLQPRTRFSFCGDEAFLSERIVVAIAQKLLQQIFDAAKNGLGCFPSGPADL